MGLTSIKKSKAFEEIFWLWRPHLTPKPFVFCILKAHKSILMNRASVGVQRGPSERCRHDREKLDLLASETWPSRRVYSGLLKQLSFLAGRIRRGSTGCSSGNGFGNSRRCIHLSDMSSRFKAFPLCDYTLGFWYRYLGIRTRSGYQHKGEGPRYR